MKGPDAEPSSTAPPALNSTAASLLGFLQGGELSGYELAGAAEAFLGRFWSLTRSQVYRELTNLAGRGLVEEGTTGARSRRPYRLTDSGRRTFRAWLAEVPAEETIRYPLLLALSFGSFIGHEEIMRFVGQHRSRHEERLEEYRATRSALSDPYQRAVLSFATHYEEAVLAWMNELPEILDPTR